MDVMNHKIEVTMKNLTMILLISLMLSGCTSLNEVKFDSTPTSNYIGKDIKITTTSDEIIEFKVESTTDSTLSGEGKSVKMDNIKKIEIKEFSVIKSISLSSGLYILGAAIIAVIVLWT